MRSRRATCCSLPPGPSTGLRTGGTILPSGWCSTDLKAERSGKLEQAADRFAQLARREWFSHQDESRIPLVVIAGHKHDVRSRPLLLDLPGQLEPIELRHADVREEQVD